MSRNKPPQILIRPARASDIDDIFAIRTGVTDNHLSHAQLAALGITPDAIRVAILGASPAWMAEVDGEAAGFVMVDGEDGSVFALFVRSTHEGLGLGRRLMAEAETFLLSRHATIWLTTDGSPAVRANGFYRRLGWHPVITDENGETRYEKRAAQSQSDVSGPVSPSSASESS